MSNFLSLRVEHIGLGNKEFLSLVYDGEAGPVHFIYKKPILGRAHWFCLETDKKVEKSFVKILDEAMSKIAEGSVCL